MQPLSMYFKRHTNVSSQTKNMLSRQSCFSLWNMTIFFVIVTLNSIFVTIFVPTISLKVISLTAMRTWRSGTPLPWFSLDHLIYHVIFLYLNTHVNAHALPNPPFLKPFDCFFTSTFIWKAYCKDVAVDLFKRAL